MTAPVVAIRTDYGVTTGFGHLRRCLSLGQALERLGACTHFFVSRDPGTSDATDELHGAVEVAPADAEDLHETRAALRSIGADALIVDSYKVREQALEPVEALRAAIVDHVPDAPLPVELLVNGSLDAIERKVAARADTVLLLGPEYVLLRPEFARPPERPPADRIERVLVTTGGGDATGLSATLAGWAREVFADAAIDVIVGPYFTPETVGALERAANGDPRIVLHRNPRDVRAIMLGCDLALTGGGQTTYELAATGTPAVAVSVAENQTANLRGLAARGALQWAGRVGEPDLHGRTARCLEALSDSVAARRDMSRAALAVVDGKGAERVAREILRMCREETT